MMGRKDLHDVGCYRTGAEPMQVVSGYRHNPKIHFEAPLSSVLADEMGAFVDWFNDTTPDGAYPLPALTRAGLMQPTLIALSHVIEKHKKDYYAQLNRHNHTLHVTSWLSYFANTVFEAMVTAVPLMKKIRPDPPTFITMVAPYKPLIGKENQTIAHHNTVLSQLFKLLPRYQFDSLSKQHDSTRRSDALPRWSQFVALATGHNHMNMIRRYLKLYYLYIIVVSYLVNDRLHRFTIGLYKYLMATLPYPHKVIHQTINMMPIPLKFHEFRFAVQRYSVLVGSVRIS